VFARYYITYPIDMSLLKEISYYEFITEFRLVNDDVPTCSFIKSLHLLALVSNKVIAYIV